MPPSLSKDHWFLAQRGSASTLLLSVGLATSLWLTASGPATSQTLRQKVNFANSDINAFWDKTFKQMGRKWYRPKSYTYYRAVRTACGVSGPFNALYCPRDHGIYLNIPFLVRADRRWGDFAAITIMAHEYGHAVQRQLGLSRLNRYLYQEELQADCFAGVYAQYASRKGLLDPNDAREGYYQSYSSGHARFNPNTHGTRTQRAQAFRTGYRNGFRSCLKYTVLRFRR
ncbi:neutral zinc metallopeptidase [Acaryochloris sp. IP29b_bin.137]|uniref:neutral zinc metallopeptidase n=1 Tax=Acaryochloris sp. IP29b_bin.137 TaxID=2969217 RepID=UPI00261B3EC1|nr:neutral zinc metallopeptidase [Acaryochloris sp. IP29b_bin.137]